jgi:uncharacterized protein
MIERRLHDIVNERLDSTPAVVLTGPRQVGKTTIAVDIASKRDALYLDLESERDRAALREPELFLEQQLHRLVILDEVHRMPELYPILRGMIDKARRQNQRVGKYLLLGSASQHLLRQSGESLAGRVSYLELHGLDLLEVGGRGLSQEGMWLRGSFPESVLSTTDEQSARWRSNFIRTYLEREIPQFAPRLAAETLRRFWTMLAHGQGGRLNNAELARSMGVNVRTTSSYLDLMVDLMLVRRLQPWFQNVGKRLTKAPKIYVRDSGILHALLRIDHFNTLISHPIVGASWEGFVIEQVAAVLPENADLYYYRTNSGAEIDLLIAWPGGTLWAIEIKRSESSALSRGFHEGCLDLEPERKYLVHGGEKAFPYSDEVQAVSLVHLMKDVINNA